MIQQERNMEMKNETDENSDNKIQIDVKSQDLKDRSRNFDTFSNNYLDKTDDFLEKLNQLSSSGHSTCGDKEWTLILIDCDDVGILLHNKTISMTQAQNSINLLTANIGKHVNENNNDSVFGYHLGSDLFALFVYDNASTMNKSIEIVESLLNVMRNKQESSLTISVGIGFRMLKSKNNKDHNSDNVTTDHDSIKRKWVSCAYTNLLRAKENGKNCYFKIENNINLNNDHDQDDKKLRSLIIKVDQLYDQCLINKCENLIYDILKNYKQDRIIKQRITSQNKGCVLSIYIIQALIIFYRKTHIGNLKYRAYVARKCINLTMKTFLLGNMGVECYYYYKRLQLEIEDEVHQLRIDTRQKISQENEQRLIDPTNHITEKYDLTLLTRTQCADPIVKPVIKGSSLYYSKNAFEHLPANSKSRLIVFSFARKAVEIGEAAFDYIKQLYQDAFKCDPDCRIPKHIFALVLWQMNKYDESLDYTETVMKDVEMQNNIRFLSSTIKRYRNSCKSSIDEKMNDKKLTKDERLNKAIEYGQQMLHVAEKEKEWVLDSTYYCYGAVLYASSKDFDKNKEQQVTALKMYEKGLKMDQQFGYDIINNWIRDFDKFEHELVNIIVDYWYIPDKLNISAVLDYVDLIQTYFNHDESKIKRAKKLYCSTPPYGVVVKSTPKRRKKYSYASVKKPSMYIWRRCTRQNVSGLYTKLASWDLDQGGQLSSIANTSKKNNNDHESTTQFTASFAAKLICFFTFYKDYKNFIINELGLTIDMIKKMRIVIIKLLMHYSFRLEKKEHKSIIEMIKDSIILTSMIDKMNHVLSLEDFGIMCDKIEKKIDLQSEQVLTNMAQIIFPYIVTNKQQKIESVNGQDISLLFEESFDFEQEMLYCFVELVAMGNYYNEKHSFVRWNTSVKSREFASALICCVLEMFCQIVKEHNAS